MTPEDEAKVDEFYMNLRKENKNFRIQCYSSKSSAAKALADNLGTFDDMTAKLNAVISAAVADLDSGVPQERLANDFEELNKFLGEEAERLNVQNPGLPNPQDLATDVVNVLKAAGN